MWTKIVAGLMTLFVLISSCIGAANMHFDLKRDVVRNENNISIHKVDDEKKWDKAWMDIDGNTDDINKLQLQNARLETQYQEILRRLEASEANDLRILEILSNFEVVQ